MLHSIDQSDPDLAAVFSEWCTGTTEHRMHYESAYTKISANSGVDQGCPLSTCSWGLRVFGVLRVLRFLRVLRVQGFEGFRVLRVLGFSGFWEFYGFTVLRFYGFTVYG